MNTKPLWEAVFYKPVAGFAPETVLMSPSSSSTPQFITATDLERIYGNRSKASCQRDFQFLKALFGVKEKVPGLPIRRYAEYVDVPLEDIQARLRTWHH